MKPTLILLPDPHLVYQVPPGGTPEHITKSKPQRELALALHLPPIDEEMIRFYLSALRICCYSLDLGT